MIVTINGKDTTVKIHDPVTCTVSANPSAIYEGESSTVTFTTTGIPDGTTKPFTISGSGLPQLSNQPTNGLITIYNNSATINVVTKNIQATEDTSLTIKFDPDGYFCSKADATITIRHKGVPPVIIPDTNCDWVTIPIDWCGTYDGTSGVMKTIFPVGTMSVLKSIAGQPHVTVPLTAKVENNVITILTTADVLSTTNQGGKLAYVITSFDNVTPGVKKVTGTTVQLDRKSTRLNSSH